MVKRLWFALVFLLSLLSQGAKAEAPLIAAVSSNTRSGWGPSSVLAQHAGYAGFAAVGIGYASDSDRFGLDLLYGFTPALYAGHDVHSFGIKGLWTMATVALGRQYQWRPYTGLHVLYNPHPDLFVMLPRQYPDSYYVPSAIRPALVLGFALRWQETRELGFEYAALDSELAYYRDTKRFETREIGSFGMNVRWLLK